MSGQPYKYASDPAKFRDEFMKTLALQASINAMNLDANKTYAETGQLPPVSQMKDTRTTAEILADTERLKLDMIKELEPVANPQFASVVLQRIQQSPLNLDGSLFTFFVQRAPEIVKNLQKMYKYKIKGDANDAETFVKFIEEMYTKTKNMTGSVKSFFNRPASELTKGAAISKGELEKISSMYQDVAKRLLLKANKVEYRHLYRILSNITSSLNIYRLLLNEEGYITSTKIFIASQTPDFYPTESIERSAVNLDEISVRDFYDIYTKYNDLLESYPKGEVLYTLVKQLEKSVANANPSLTERIALEIESQLSLTPSIARLYNDIRRFAYNHPQFGNTNTYNPVNVPNPANVEPADVEFEEANEGPDEGLTFSDLTPYPDIDLSRIYDYLPDLGISKFFSKSENEKKLDEINAEIRSLSDKLEQLNAIKNGPDFRNESLTDRKKIEDEHKKINGRLIELSRAKRQQEEIVRNETKGINPFEEEEEEELVGPGGGGPRRGHGLIKRRGRPKGSGIRKTYKESIITHQDLSKGVDEYPRFVKFGKYLINTRKLHDNTLSLKSSSGNGVINIPSKRISANLTATIKKMINGGTIGFSDISGLSEPEKAYLHKVAKQSGILEKFDIPAPSKDAHEKDIHEFEVMKGEIMSGNDSTELIKRFKLHIMKLSRNGTLPKHEVNEILSDLVNLGY